MTNPLSSAYRARFGLPADLPEPEQGTDALARMLAHRTHRRYSERPLPDDLIDALLAACLSTPSKSDLQQVSILRIADPAPRQAIGELIPSMPWIVTAPAFFVFCGDSRRIRRICELRGRPFANDHLDAMLNAAVDAGMHLSSFIHAAEAVGLGCCPISVVRNHIFRIGELLGLPDGVFPVAGLCLGYPAREGYVSLRLAPAITVHRDRYDDSALASELEGYDRRRNARYAIPREQQREPERWGEVDLYGWSEDKARQVAIRERDDLAAYLRAKGFNLD